MDFAKYRRVIASDELPNVPVTIYALIDPRDDTVRYVGQTTRPKERASGHASVTSRAVRRWLSEVRAAGCRPVLRPIVRVAESEADFAERYWISFYRSVGLLLNAKDGGRAPEWGNCQRCGTVTRCQRCSRLLAAEKERVRIRQRWRRSDSRW